MELKTFNDGESSGKINRLIFLLFLFSPGLTLAGEESGSSVVSGLNFWGHPGLLVQDTAEAYGGGLGRVTLNPVYESFGDRENTIIPLGVNLAVSRDFSFYSNAAAQVTAYKDSNVGHVEGINRFELGGNYVFRNTLEGLDTSLALDVSVGPLDSALGDFTTNINLKMMATFRPTHQWLLNSELGAYLIEGAFRDYLQFSLGAIYAFDSSLNGVVEFLHHTRGGPDVPGTVGVIGVRIGGDIHAQAFAGTKIDSPEAPGFMTGIGGTFEF